MKKIEFFNKSKFIEIFFRRFYSCKYYSTILTKEIKDSFLTKKIHADNVTFLIKKYLLKVSICVDIHCFS